MLIQPECPIEQLGICYGVALQLHLDTVLAEVPIEGVLDEQLDGASQEHHE